MKTFFSFGKTLIENDFATAQKTASELGTYEKSEAKLAPKTFREQYEQLVSFVNFFAVLYPIASIITGLATIYLGASLFISGTTFVDYLSFAVVLILGLIVLFGNEKFKESTLNAFFHAKFNQNKANFIFVLPLLISIAFSSYGGLLLSQKSNDKTSDFVGFEKSAIDSVKSAYSMQLQNDSLLVADLGNSLAKEKSKWTKIALREQLNNAQIQYAQTKKQIGSEIANHASKTEKSITSNQTNGLKIAIICAIIIAIFELVLVLCVWFSFWFASGCRTENRNFNFVDVSHLVPLHVVNSTHDITHAISAKHNENSIKGKGIGFEFKHENSAQNSLNDNSYHRKHENSVNCTCKNCGKSFEKNAKKQIFCSNECRYQWHNFIPRSKK